VLVRAFIDALTQGGPGGTPKPIEMHAHDPKRYVGDMLAWLHQTMPNERENLLILLKGCDKTGVSLHSAWFLYIFICHLLCSVTHSSHRHCLRGSCENKLFSMTVL
jgi:hypothetical protein